MSRRIISFPSFDDFRKLANFWIDQQDKWFYFEIEALQAGTESRGNVGVSGTANSELIHYIQNRLVGRIFDVVPFPPSLLLHETTIFTVLLDVGHGTKEITKVETRSTYGLVFSQITYYEPIENWDAFIHSDLRVSEFEQD